MGELRGAYLREAVLHISGLRPRRSECRGRSTTRASCRASCRACSARLAGRTRIRSRAVFVVPRHTRSTTLPTRDYKPAVHESAIQLFGVCKMMGPPFKEHSHILHDIATKFKESWAWIRDARMRACLGSTKWSASSPAVAQHVFTAPRPLSADVAAGEVVFFGLRSPATRKEAT